MNDELYAIVARAYARYVETHRPPTCTCGEARLCPLEYRDCMPQALAMLPTIQEYRERHQEGK